MNQKIKRIDKPDDKFRKISHTMLGKTVHKYFELPGKFIGTIENEIPDGKNNEKRTDGGYQVSFNGNMIISIEDESSVVNMETLEKIYKYCVNMEYVFGSPVYSVITTIVPLENCMESYSPSETMLYLPKIISFNEFDGDKRLENARIKVRNDEEWDDVEGYDLVNIPKMFDKGNDIALEEVCELFSQMRMSNRFIKYALGRCLQCMISKYAKSLDDVFRLEEMINMVSLKGDADAYIEEIREEARVEGKLEERLDLARKFARSFDIDEVARISGLSKDQILSER